jgi:D-alanyl-D-alanine carboxypeptidase (penicillin-binding protein 5/6)
MKLRLSPLKFVDLLVVAFCVAIFVLTPLTPLPPSPSVKSATTSTLTIPQAKTNAPTAPVLTANAIYVFDPDSGTEIYQKNSTDRFYPASTTKLMTALVALSAYNLDEVLTVKSAGDALGQSIHLSAGDKLTFENLLYGLLVDSGNDAAVVIAENFPGGYTQFISRMNQKVRELNLKSTHFTNVTGLFNSDHYTSAADLTLIAREAIGNATIRKIVATKNVTFTDITGSKKFILESTNKLLDIDGVKGLKTGWTPESGECLVTLVTRDGKSVLITLLSSTDRFGESAKLINWVYDNFDWKQI